MDEALSKLYEVQFFFSAITGTQNHAKQKKQEKSKDLTSQEKEERDKSQANQEISILEWRISLPTLPQLNVIQTLSLPCYITWMMMLN